MNFFKKSNTKDAPQNELDKLFSAYWSNQEEIKALQAEAEQLKEKILCKVQNDNLFKEGKQTATIGTNKVSYTDKPKLIIPRGFNFADFKADFPSLVRTEMNETLIAKAILEDGDVALQDYGLDAEYVRSWSIKKQ